VSKFPVLETVGDPKTDRNFRYIYDWHFNVPEVSPVCKFTDDGGLAVKFTNGTGSVSVLGEVVSASQTADGHIVRQANEFDSIGVVNESGVPNGEDVWVTVSGKARVLLKNGTSCTTGQLAIAADTDGRMLAINNPGSGLPATETHFKEIGHVMETKGSGTDVLAMIVLHFN
jgi:hypothetical protein